MSTFACRPRGVAPPDAFRLSTPTASDAAAPIDARVDSEPLDSLALIRDDQEPVDGEWLAPVSLAFSPAVASAANLRVYNLVDHRWLSVQASAQGPTVLAAYGDLLMALDGAGHAALQLVDGDAHGLRTHFSFEAPRTFEGRVYTYQRGAPNQEGAPIEGAYVSVIGSELWSQSPPAGVFARPRVAVSDALGSGWSRYCGAPSLDPRLDAVRPVRSDAQGDFTLRFRGRWTPATICAPGHIPQNFAWMSRVQLTDPPAPLVMTLVRALPIRGRVVGENGEPVSGVLVRTEVVPGAMMPDGILNHTDAIRTGLDGTFSLDAPEGEPRNVIAVVPGSRPIRVENVAAGAASVRLTVRSFRVPEGLRAIMGAVYHRVGGTAENLVLESDGNFRAESAWCSRASIVEGTWSGAGTQGTLSSVRTMDWRIYSLGVFSVTEGGAGSWLGRQFRTQLGFTLERDQSITLRWGRGAAAITARYIPGAECVACTERGLMAGTHVRTGVCPGHGVQRWDNGTPEPLRESSNESVEGRN